MKDKFEMVGKKIEVFSLPNSRGENTSINKFSGKNIIVALLRGIS